MNIHNVKVNISTTYILFTNKSMLYGNVKYYILDKLIYKNKIDELSEHIT